MADILLVEDSLEIRDAVCAVLGEHRVHWVSTLKDAQVKLTHRHSAGAHFDLVLLDIDLPDGDGIEFLEREKASFGKSTGTILLTGTNTVTSRVKGFTLGALDYIAKPFDLEEFQVRVNAKLGLRQAAERAPMTANIISRGYLELDLTRQQAFNTQIEPKRQLDLTPVEFRLLLLFMQNYGTAVKRDEILETVWGQTAHVSARSVDHHVCGLRKKISGAEAHIESVYGVGYRIDG